MQIITSPSLRIITLPNKHRNCKNSLIWTRKSIAPLRQPTSAVAMCEIHERQLKFVDHPPYLPGLSPSGYILFPKLKVWLGGQRFTSNEEVVHSVNAYPAEQDVN